MSLLDKLKNLSKTNERDLFKMKKTESSKITVPKFARLTTDKQLQCTICNVLVKNEVVWLKHAKTDKHLNGIKIIQEKSASANKGTSAPLHKNNIEAFTSGKQNKSELEQEKLLDKIIIPNQEEINISQKPNVNVNMNKSTESKHNIMKFLEEQTTNTPQSLQLQASLPEGFFDKKFNKEFSRNEYQSSKTEAQSIQTKQQIKTEIITSSNYSNNIEEIKPLPEEVDDNLEEDFSKEVETMIECTHFIGNLINKKHSYAAKYENVLQKEELITENLNDDIKGTFLKRKRRLDQKYSLLCEGELNVTDTITLSDTDKLFDFDWRKQGMN